MRHLLALVFCSLVSTAALAADVDGPWREARIRPQDPRLTTVLREGMARSATFRALVNPFQHRLGVLRRESHLLLEQLARARPVEVFRPRGENELLGAGPVERLLLAELPAVLLHEQVHGVLQRLEGLLLPGPPARVPIAGHQLARRRRSRRASSHHH